MRFSRKKQLPHSGVLTKEYLQRSFCQKAVRGYYQSSNTESIRYKSREKYI